MVGVLPLSAADADVETMAESADIVEFPEAPVETVSPGRPPEPLLQVDSAKIVVKRAGRVERCNWYSISHELIS
jgi:hypothetical protein